MNTLLHLFKARIGGWLIATLAALLLAACGGGGSDTMGTLGVSLTDDPACGFDKVYVTVDRVRVHQSSTANSNDAGWTDLMLNPPRKIDLLSLENGALEDLGQTPLPAGHYTQLRLVLAQNGNSVVVSGGSAEVPLDTPSAMQSGIKLINQFDVVAGQRVDLMLDFNACMSIVTRASGHYALKPVVKVIPFTLNGIDGFVDTALLASHVMVSAQQNGTIVQSTVPNASTGEFFLSRLPVGNYDVVITADGYATEVIASVPVTSSTSVVNVSDSTTRISLPASVTHTVTGTAVLNPASATEVAYVAAKQTFGTAPTVTVQYVAADDASAPPGAYALILPASAPLLGLYTTPLPITVAAQSGVAGQYHLEASATGYQTQSVSTDVSTSDVTQDFVLVP